LDEPAVFLTTLRDGQRALLSCVIPSVILGKERGVLVQFVVCLILTFVAFVIQDVIMAYGYGSLGNMLGLVTFLNNPVFAAAYLSTPYVLMLLLDLRSRKRRKMERILENQGDLSGTRTGHGKKGTRQVGRLSERQY